MLAKPAAFGPETPVFKILDLENNTSVTLRRAALPDSDALYELYQSVYGGNYTLPIVNLRANREQALQDPACLWLVAEGPDGAIIGSVIFTLDLAQRHAKVFAAVVQKDYRRANLAFHLLEGGIRGVLYVDRLVDVIYATTRTRTMGPNNLLHKLGFVSLGIFPNVHRVAEYETHGLKALFHPDAFAGRERRPRLIPEVAGFYDIMRRSYGLGEAEIVPLPGKLKLSIVKGPEAVEACEQARATGALLMDFFPFHPVTHMFTTEAGHVRAFINREGKDGHAVLVALQAVRDSVGHLEHVFHIIFETARTIGIDYMELLVSAYEPNHQRAALSAHFLPCAYFPGMAQGRGEREDYLVFARSVLPLDFSHVQLTPRDRHFLDVYLLNTEFRNLVVQMQEAGPQEVF